MKKPTLSPWIQQIKKDFIGLGHVFRMTNNMIPSVSQKWTHHLERGNKEDQKRPVDKL